MLFGKKGKADRELEEYRSLLSAPAQYEEGFTVRTILGVLFVAIIMVPGNMYLQLMIGGGLGAAAQWVTIILFLEIAKRSFTVLKRQEIYLLYYATIALVASTGAGTLFSGLLWNQYLVQSPAAKQFGISTLIPAWVSPQPDSPAIIARTFFHRDWLPPIALMLGGLVIWRVSWFCMGYILFRLTSDMERLPFPFAPIAAQGAMALAESSSGEEGWRWRMFSTGAMIGVVFGAIYVAIPAISGAILPKPIQLIPIPWVDFTQITGNFLPATPLGFTAHLGPIFAGLLAPFWAVMGTFIGVMVHTIASPILYHYGFLPNWHQGMDTIRTIFVCRIDFWMSFGIGVTLAVACISFYQIMMGLRRRKASGEVQGRRRSGIPPPPPGRGDFPIWLCLLLYAVAYAGLILIAIKLFPAFSTTLLIFFLFFAFVYTPLMSFINARMIGLVGQFVDLPLVRQAAIVLSGYRGIDIWFIPFPLGNFGAQASKFREIELTGTKFTSVLKAEVFMVPIIVGASFMYWSYIWKLAPIPSASYPYVQLMWPLQAYTQCVWLTGTFRGEMKEEADRVSWSPANLTGGDWWYWRSRVNDGTQYGGWSEIGYFYAEFGGKSPPSGPKYLPEEFVKAEAPPARIPGNAPPTAPKMVGPAEGIVVRTPTPALMVKRARDPDGDELEYYFEVDQVPTFDSPWKQTSTDENWLFTAIKWKIITSGFLIAIVSFVALSALGLPILLLFGYVRNLSSIPHFVVTEIIGAFIARYYFWKKYGRQQWRLYATVLAVGFAVGMSLIGMASVAIALIQKAVSVLIF